jgi:hypothetical protein
MPRALDSITSNLRQEVERQHLGEEWRIPTLKEAARELAEPGVAHQEGGGGINPRVESAIIGYNSVCAVLLGKLIDY